MHLSISNIYSMEYWEANSKKDSEKEYNFLFRIFQLLIMDNNPIFKFGFSVKRYIQYISIYYKLTKQTETFSFQSLYRISIESKRANFSS